MHIHWTSISAIPSNASLPPSAREEWGGASEKESKKEGERGRERQRERKRERQRGRALSIPWRWRNPKEVAVGGGTASCLCCRPLVALPLPSLPFSPSIAFNILKIWCVTQAKFGLQQSGNELKKSKRCRRWSSWWPSWLLSSIRLVLVLDSHTCCWIQQSNRDLLTLAEALHSAQYSAPAAPQSKWTGSDKRDKLSS